MVSDGDTSEDRGVGIDRHVILDNRMTRYVQHVAVLIIFEALGTKGHTLIECHVVADDTRLTNDHTRAVVDGEILSDGGTRMDVDTSLRVRQLCDDTGDDRYLQLMQFMGDAVVRHRIHHGIAEDHLSVVRGGRVVVEHRLHIGIE